MKVCLKVLFVFLLVVSFLSVRAQPFKFGHIDLQALIQVLPEGEAAESEMNKFQQELEDVLREMQHNYQTILKELEQLGADVSEVKRDAKLSELQNLQQRIQAYQQNAQQQIQQKYQELLNPLYEKATGAIQKVAREQDLMYVFETGSRVILYHSNKSIDLLPLVKQKLGIE